MANKNDTNSAGLGLFASIKLLLNGAPDSHEQIIQLLRNAEKNNVLNKDTLEMIEGAFQVSKNQVKNIMIPRSHMVIVREDATLQDMLPIIIDSAHSRFPVIGDSRDEVLGILLAKDLLRFFIEGKQAEFSLDDVLRPAVIIPESKRVNTLLSEFKDGRNHMAIVVDEYSSVSGLVTIEDVLEQIVGEITDEHDIEDGRYIFEHSKGHFGVKALTPIEDFNEFFSTKYSDNDYETFGGLVLSKFGHLPKKGEKVEFDNFEVEVLRADKRRLQLLNVSQHI
jgi:magnesium and cobalt transporter